MIIKFKKKGKDPKQNWHWRFIVFSIMRDNQNNSLCPVLLHVALCRKSVSRESWLIDLQPEIRTKGIQLPTRGILKLFRR